VEKTNVCFSGQATPFDFGGRSLGTTFVCRKALLIGIGVWAVLVGAAWLPSLRFEFTPAQVDAHAANVWPDDANVKRSYSVPTLLLFLHPYCACSASSLQELARLAADAHDRVAIRIIAVKPTGTAESWDQTANCRAARSVYAATTVLDGDGSEAAKFGASASGETMLYSRTGQLIFHGGITPSRGHEGDSAGRQAILTLLRSGEASFDHTAVFGCPLAVHRK
jgi:hypothetical protein